MTCIPAKGKNTFHFFIKRRIMLIMTVLSSILLLSSFPYFSSENSKPDISNPVSHEITLLFAGDIMQHLPQLEAAWNNEFGIYIYDSCFKFVKPLLSSADLTIANLETTLAGKPYSGYPAFSSPDGLVSGMLNAGIDIVGTANNHCCDRGRTGIERTVNVLDSLGMMHFGTYKNVEAYRKRNPLIINTKGFRLAFLNYTYGTNANPVPEGDVVSMIEKDRISDDLKAASDAKPDKVIVFIHWGDEYQREPNDFQKVTAKFLFDGGADIIVGSHPHVLQPMEWIGADSLNKERIVVWSLGNYVSNQRKRFADGGAMFSMTLTKKKNQTTIRQAGYYLTWVFNPLESGLRRYYILPAKEYENDTILLDSISRNEIKIFLDDSRKLLNAKNIGINEL